MVRMISSPAFQLWLRLRLRAKVRVVMFAPRITSSALGALRKSAMASCAAATTASVSLLVI